MKYFARNAVFFLETAGKKAGVLSMESVEHGCFNTNVAEDFTFKCERPLAAIVDSDCARLRNPKVIMQTSLCFSSVVRTECER